MPSSEEDTANGASPSNDHDESVSSPLMRQAASYGTLRPPRDSTLSQEHDGTFPLLRHRRSSGIRNRLHEIGDLGGVNSLNNFARSWVRAAVFPEVAPERRSFVLESDLDPQAIGHDSETGLRPRRSFLRDAAADCDDGAIIDEDSIYEGARPILSRQRSPILERRSSPRQESIFSVEPQLGSPFGGSYRAGFGSLHSRVNESSIAHASRLFTEQQAAAIDEPDKETQPLIVRRIEQEDGKPVDIVVGHSTVPQTVFNSINTLIGVGMLALPMAIRYAGWVIGLGFFTLSAVVTCYTARLLAKCLDVDGSLITFADLALVSFGTKARFATSILFTLELLAACVALVVLFADSLNALNPYFDVFSYKVICGLLLIPLGFVPLRYLSVTSILGIMCCVGITVAVIVDGFVKDHALGSLLEPAQTHWFPADWRTLPLAFGLLMAPWGGHSVFPNIYRDMRHPYKYGKAISVTYIFTFLLELALAIAGYLMYGDTVRDEITANIFLTEGYPRWISIFIVIAIAIIPLTKIPLNARPIVSVFEAFCGLHARVLPAADSMTGMSGLTRGILLIAIRISVTVIIVVLAILIPSFDKIMALLGSLACFTICIILPCAFHLKIFGKELQKRQRFLDWTLIVVCTILAVAGTVAALIPKHLLGVGAP